MTGPYGPFKMTDRYGPIISNQVEMSPYDNYCFIIRFSIPENLLADTKIMFLANLDA